MLRTRHLIWIAGRVLIVSCSLLLFTLLVGFPSERAVAYAQESCGPNSSSGPFADPCKITSTSTSSGAVIQISQPKVDTSSFDYNTIIFQPGDQVTITAGGCVQTGGIGLTWKRYVDPSGANSGPPGGFYFGTVTIPGALLGSNPISNFPISDVVGQPITVRATTHLILGYADDNYPDNGYYAHDNGNNDQCLITADGGPAHVTVVIQHGVVGPFAAVPAAPFDLVPNDFDDNLLFLNPTWGWEPNGAAAIVDGTYDPSCFPGPCTSQLTTYDSPPSRFLNLFSLCNFGTTGHRNWFDVTYTGTLIWETHNDPTFGDNDFNIQLVTPPTGASGFASGATANNLTSVGLEFDAAETVDNFDAIPWWKTFHQAGVSNDAAAHAMIDGHNAIVEGLMGIDEMHDPHSEVHPVHILAIQQAATPNPADDAWSIFVRNWGDEGECSSEQHFLDLTSLTVRIPRPAAAPTGTTPTMGPNTNFAAINFQGAATPSLFLASNQDALVQFQLPPGSNQGSIVGELHLNWTDPPGTAALAPSTSLSNSVVNASLPPLTNQGSADPPPTDDPEQDMNNIAAGVSPAQRTLYLNLLGLLLPPTPVSVTFLPPPQIVNVPPAIPKSVPTVSEGPAVRKLQRDVAEFRAMCAAMSGNLPTQPSWCPVANFPPVTVLTTTGGAQGQNGWLITPVVVTLTANDATGAGINFTEYSFDNQHWTIYSGPFTLPEGQVTLYYRSQDNHANLEETRQQSFKIDTTPPSISGMPTPPCILWPPDRKLVQAATVTASDTVSGLAFFNVVGASNEPSDADGPDIVISGNGLAPRGVQLRAERLGTGNGRIYTLTATASNQAGNSAHATATCTVPHDRRP